MKKIETFTLDETRFMSNFFPWKKDGTRYTYQENGKEVPYNLVIWFDDECYSCTELAYMAAKTTDIGLRYDISQMSPFEAKAYWQENADKVRDDFDEIKVQVMTEINRQKYFGHPRLMQLLKDTGDAILEEGNTWGDVFWGKCDGVGENNLGKILMNIRDGLPVDCLYKKGGELVVSNKPIEDSEFIGFIPYADKRMVMRQHFCRVTHQEALSILEKANSCQSGLKWYLIDCTFAMDFFSDRVKMVNETLKAIGQEQICDLSYAGFGSDYAFDNFILDDPREMEGKKAFFSIAKF